MFECWICHFAVISSNKFVVSRWPSWPTPRPLVSSPTLPYRDYNCFRVRATPRWHCTNLTDAYPTEILTGTVHISVISANWRRYSDNILAAFCVRACVRASTFSHSEIYMLYYNNIDHVFFSSTIDDPDLIGSDIVKDVLNLLAVSRWFVKFVLRLF